MGVTASYQYPQSFAGRNMTGVSSPSHLGPWMVAGLQGCAALVISN